MTDADRLLRLLERAGAQEQDDLIRLVAIGALSRNERIAERIDSVVQAKATQHYTYPFETTAMPETAAERVDLGASFTGSAFDIAEALLTRHVLVTGQTGAGKTTLFYNLMEQLSVPFWSFDLKQDYRHLIQENDELLVLPWSRLRFNPLRPPPGVMPQRWAQVFAEVFGHSNALLSASKNYVMAAVMEMYEQTGVLDDGTEYPTLHELETAIDENTVQPYSKESQYRGTVLNRLDGMNRVAGDIFACRDGYRLPELLERNVVFEFDGLRTDLQDFLMECLFAAVYEYRLANAHRDGDLRHAFFLDEGKRVFSVFKERSDAAGIPHVSEVTAKMREFGEALIVADQEPAKLSGSIMANTHTKVLLPIGDATQFNRMAASMNLSDRQKQYAHQLGIGQGLVRVGNRDAVPVQFTEYSIEKSVDDTELFTQQQDMWQQLSDSIETSIAEAAETGETPAVDTEQPSSAEEISEPEVSPDGMDMLRDVVDRAFVPLSRRYELFSSTGKGNAVKNRLLDAGLLRERWVEDGRKFKLLELTERGREVLAGHDVVVNRTGRGGVVHRYWQNTIQEVFSDSGYNSVIEQDHADVAVDLDEKRVAIEVAMESTDREVGHVADRFEAGFDAVWFACRSERVREQLEQMLAAENLLDEQVRLHLFQEWRDVESLLE